MSKQDDRLEEKIIALEEGVQPEKVMGGRSNSSELQSLVNVAASIRDLPHPELDQQTIQSDKRRLISAARDKNRASRNFKATKSSGFTGLWLFVPAVAGVALILLMVFVLAAGAGLYYSGPRGAQAAILSDATGVLEVSETGVAGDWRLATNGDQVRSGQRLRTGDESWVTLEFFDGTRTTLAPNTDLVLNKIDGNWGDELQVSIIQNEGETNHEVIPLQGDQAAYHVLTPSGEASVKGTSFSVLVEDTGVSLFTVETGEVLVNNDGFETFVSAGQSVVTELGVPMDVLSYKFTLQGAYGPKSGNTRYVDGVAFKVRGWTSVEGNPTEGDFVEVEGRINKKGEWVADTITKLNASVAFEGTFTGLVTEQAGNIWTIGGFDLQVDPSLTDIGIGDLVRVTFHVDGSGWIADSIELVDGDQDDDEILFFYPEESEITDCEPVVDSKREFTTTLNYVPGGESPQPLPLEVELTLSDNRGELEPGLVDSIKISQDGTIFEFPHTITLLHDAGPIYIDVIVTLGTNFDSLPPESKLEIQVVATEVVSDTVVSEPLSATFKIEWECDEEVLFFSPEESEITDCEPVTELKREFTTSLNYVPTGVDPQPLEVELTLSDNRGELEPGLVDSIKISQDGTIFEFPHTITLLHDAGPIYLDVIVTLGTNFDSLPPESKLEIQVVATEEAPDMVDGVPLSAIFKVEWECDEELPDDEFPDEGDYCTGADPHPHATTLAEDYSDLPGVSYGKIMEWFCDDNLGFGEIELGFKLYLEYEEVLPLEGIATVDDIFALRLGGMGWGQVKHEMASLAREALTDDEPAGKKEPPGKEKSEEAKNKPKPDKKNKNDD